ncbi:hypothetical protein GQ42DRAFT_52110 [Ramicandelaber brevisporus]|nr:hypothetical protein GQ42DRAFT_52110 [Ramicandelaber brevisporus]
MVRSALFTAACLLFAGIAGVVEAGNLKPSEKCSDTAYDGNALLGPLTLPTEGVVGKELKGYSRFGKLNKNAFMTKYYDPSASGGKGGWIYPPAEGYVVGPDGKPIKHVANLPKDKKIDRFGREYGAYLSPAETKYGMRALPPTNLNNIDGVNCGYHQYKVLKPFNVDAGPIATWFEQPGGGEQYKLVASYIPGAPTNVNVLWMVENHYLQRL